MELLKKLTEICERDIRQDSFVVIDHCNPGVFRKHTIEDFHRATESIVLMTVCQGTFAPYTPQHVGGIFGVGCRIAIFLKKNGAHSRT